MIKFSLRSCIRAFAPSILAVVAFCTIPSARAYPGFGMFQICDQSMRQEQRLLLSALQKQELSLRLELSLKRRHGDAPPEPVRGMEGLKVADQLLKEKGLAGYLVGGLAVAVWNQTTTLEAMAAHKDVDVVVMPERAGDWTSAEEASSKFKKFEGGIDWWLPRLDRIEQTTSLGGAASRFVDFTFNGNGVVFDVDMKYRYVTELKPGLHILNREGVVKLRTVESAVVREWGDVVDSDVFEAIKRKAEKEVRRGLCRPVREYFKPLGQVVDGATPDLARHDLQTLSAIERHVRANVLPSFR